MHVVYMPVQVDANTVTYSGIDRQ